MLLMGLIVFFCGCGGNVQQSVESLPPETSSVPTSEEPAATEQMNQFHLGVYVAPEYPDAFTIKAIGENEVEFNIAWLRTASLDDTVARKNGEKWEFQNQGTTGYFVLISEDTIKVTLLTSDLPFIEPGDFVFEYQGTEETLETDHYESILLMNDDEAGWVILADDHLSVPDRPAFFFRFYDNGTMTYWMKESTGSENYKEYQGTYQINTDTILLNGDEYRFFAETTGVTRMTLDAVGEYEIDFSGYYICETNEIYQVLNYNTKY